MKKMLYIVYYYPPIGGSGVQRGAKFSMYLPLFGWESIILTASPSLVRQPRDFSLMSEVNPGQKIYSSFTIDAQWLFRIFWGLRLPKLVIWLTYHFFIPDAQILWLPFAKRRIKQLMKREKPELVFISGPPFSPMLLGRWIKHRYGIPYVLDFRDDWSQGQSRLDNPPPLKFSSSEKRLEYQVLQHAAQVVVVNKAHKADFAKLYPDLDGARFSLITNGYDENDFISLKTERSKETDKLQIVHTGQMYDRRNPRIIWQAICNLAARGEIDPDRLRIHIYGRNFASFVFKGYEQNELIKKVVQLHPYLPHSETIKVICEADILLLFSGPGAKSDAELPGKLFEYLRAGKPILGVVHPKGVCAEIFLQARSGVVASQEDLGQIENKLKELYQQWQQGKLATNPDWEYIRQFERKALTAKLADVFNSVLAAK